MLIKINRNILTSKSTIGQMIIDEITVDTLEDPIRKIKLYGKTCIPEGQYQLALRTEGGKHEKYLKRFGPDFHKGMLWLKDVPGFEYIYIHIGNNPDDTLGCILVGTSIGTDYIQGSEGAYRNIYPKIADAILAGKDVLVDVSNPGD